MVSPELPHAPNVLREQRVLRRLLQAVVMSQALFKDSISRAISAEFAHPRFFCGVLFIFFMIKSRSHESSPPPVKIKPLYKLIRSLRFPIRLRLVVFVSSISLQSFVTLLMTVLSSPSSNKSCLKPLSNTIGKSFILSFLIPKIMKDNKVRLLIKISVLRLSRINRLVYQFPNKLVGCLTSHKSSSFSLSSLITFCVHRI